MSRIRVMGLTHERSPRKAIHDEARKRVMQMLTCGNLGSSLRERERERERVIFIFCWFLLFCFLGTEEDEDFNPCASLISRACKFLAFDYFDRARVSCRVVCLLFWKSHLGFGLDLSHRIRAKALKLESVKIT
ncbi:hypothetical protein VNO78_01880 [Psophocarpus tetragonolobus]|uniref:Uncharacterized protein n=1 Tax=Psophocarpus tetragonolobus TaxID=3891 RepID=A0AAN9XVR1_PSOTE